MKKRLLATFLSMAMVAGLATGCSTPGGGKDGGASESQLQQQTLSTAGRDL